jgi:hypothetical protein
MIIVLVTASDGTEYAYGPFISEGKAQEIEDAIDSHDRHVRQVVLTKFHAEDWKKV